MTAEALAALTASSLLSLLTSPPTLSCNRPQTYRAATSHGLSLQRILLVNKAPFMERRRRRLQCHVMHLPPSLALLVVCVAQGQTARQQKEAGRTT